MNEYLAMRINDGALEYWKVMKRFPKRKNEIDTFLKEEYNYQLPTEEPQN